MRTYKLSIETSRLLRGLLLVFLIFFVFSISLPFLPIGESDNADNLVTIAITGAIVWGLASVYIFKIIRKLPYANVCVDDEGLWYAHKPRTESLVKWEDIAEVIARPILERLDLLGSAGNRLIKIEYQLINFSILKTTILKKSTARFRDGHK